MDLLVQHEDKGRDVCEFDALATSIGARCFGRHRTSDRINEEVSLWLLHLYNTCFECNCDCADCVLIKCGRASEKEM